MGIRRDAKRQVKGLDAGPQQIVTVSRPVGGVLSASGEAGWPSIYAAYPGMWGGPPIPCAALLRVGFAEPVSYTHLTLPTTPYV